MVTFRSWCQLMWVEHVEEVSAWTGGVPDYLSKEYFNKYRWWLKREYRHLQG